MGNQNSYTYDAALLLKDAGLVAADGAATVATVARIINLGANSRFNGVCLIEVSAIEVATGDERYAIHLQGSTSPTFASGIRGLAMLELGDDTTVLADADSVAGRYEMPFTNEQAGVLYQYIRIYTDVAGTIATGINFIARIGKLA